MIGDPFVFTKHANSQSHIHIYIYILWRSSLAYTSFLLRLIVLEFFAIFNFFSANGNRIANNFCYKESAKKNKRHFLHFFCLYVARPQISDSHFYAGSDHQETQSPISQEAKTKPHYQQYHGQGFVCTECQENQMVATRRDSVINDIVICLFHHPRPLSCSVCGKTSKKCLFRSTISALIRPFLQTCSV